MKKIYVNIITLLVGIPALFYLFMTFLLLHIGDLIVPKSWYIAHDEFWKINEWIDRTGYNLTQKM